MTYIRKMVNIETNESEMVMLAPSNDFYMEPPTRAYITVKEIEQRYEDIYDRIKEFASEQPDIPVDSPILTVEKHVREGGSLPSFLQLPAEAQAVIWVVLDSDEGWSTFSVESAGFVASFIRHPSTD